MDRSPPSWNPPGNDGVDLARGTLRDALGALGNLTQLAGSTRVGSKAIENVLPDVLASTGPMRTATSIDSSASFTSRSVTVRRKSRCG